MKLIKKPKKTKMITIVDEGPDVDDPIEWAETMAKEIDEACEKEFKKPKEKKKKKKKADKLFKKLGYVKASEDIEMVEYRSNKQFSKIIIGKREATKKGYTVRCELYQQGFDSESQNISGEEVEAIRKKAKEKGWR